jgi:hypothetical protein
MRRLFAAILVVQLAACSGFPDFEKLKLLCPAVA